MVRKNESGLTLIELLVASAVSAMIIGGTSLLVFQTISTTRQTNDRITAVKQLEDAAEWLDRDGKLAEVVLATSDVTPPDILTMRWTEWGYSVPTVYHSVTYTVVDIAGSTGKLMRTHQDTSGTNEQEIIAEDIYYNPSDTANTTKMEKLPGVLNIKLTTSVGETQISRMYQADSRTSLFH